MHIRALRGVCSPPSPSQSSRLDRARRRGADRADRPHRGPGPRPSSRVRSSPTATTSGPPPTPSRAAATPPTTAPTPSRADADGRVGRRDDDPRRDVRRRLVSRLRRLLHHPLGTRRPVRGRLRVLGHSRQRPLHPGRRLPVRQPGARRGPVGLRRVQLAAVPAPGRRRRSERPARPDAADGVRRPRPAAGAGRPQLHRRDGRQPRQHPARAGAHRWRRSRPTRSRATSRSTRPTRRPSRRPPTAAPRSPSPTPGWHRIKADKTGYVRSNRLDVCVRASGETGCGPLPVDARVRSVDGARPGGPRPHAGPASGASSAARAARSERRSGAAVGSRDRARLGARAGDRALEGARPGVGVRSFALASRTAGAKRWTVRASGTQDVCGAQAAGRRGVAAAADGRRRARAQLDPALGSVLVPRDDALADARPRLGCGERPQRVGEDRQRRRAGRRACASGLRAGRPVLFVRGVRRAARIELTGAASGRCSRSRPAPPRLRAWSRARGEPRAR